MEEEKTEQTGNSEEMTEESKEAKETEQTDNSEDKAEEVKEADETEQTGNSEEMTEESKEAKETEQKDNSESRTVITYETVTANYTADTEYTAIVDQRLESIDNRLETMCNLNIALLFILFFACGSYMAHVFWSKMKVG